jgi:hypothetical protein
LLLSYISWATRKHSPSLELDRDTFWYDNPKKQEVDYADLVNKNNIYNNLLQEIPEYMSLGDNSGLDSNDFEYLLALRYFSL